MPGTSRPQNTKAVAVAADQGARRLRRNFLGAHTDPAAVAIEPVLDALPHWTSRPMPYQGQGPEHGAEQAATPPCSQGQLALVGT